MNKQTTQSTYAIFKPTRLELWVLQHLSAPSMWHCRFALWTFNLLPPDEAGSKVFFETLQ